MRLLYKFIFGFLFIFIIFILIKFLIWIYYEYNERRGYCTSEGRFLTDEEKINNLKVDIFTIKLEKLIRAKKQGWYVDNSFLFISKYPLSNEEEVINTILKSKVNKSFEENLGLIAVGTVSEYINREKCLKNKIKCFDFSYDKKNLKSLWTSQNYLDVNYIKKIPMGYSIVTNFGDVYPLSTIKKISNNIYSIKYYSFNPLCCNINEINSEINNVKARMKNEKWMSNKKILVDGESVVNVNKVDGKEIDNIYISKIYEDLVLTQPEQIQHYGILMSIGSLRRKLIPSEIEILVTACGTISEEEQWFNSSKTQSGDKPSLRKRYKL